MKYIIYNTPSGKLPVIFPESIPHVSIHTALRAHFDWGLHSAGFVAVTDTEITVHGQSFGLKTKPSLYDPEILKYHINHEHQ